MRTPGTNKGFAANLASVLLVMFMVTLFFAFLESQLPNFFLNSDNATYYLPYFAHNWRSLIDNGTLPFVSFHQFMGIAYLGETPTAVLYPPVYLSLLISKMLIGSELHTIDILTYVHFLIGSVGMFLLLRKLRITVALSILGSLFWMTLPALVSISQAQMSKAYLIAYLPMNFYFLEKLLDEPKARNVAGLTITKFLLFLGGYVQNLVMIAIFEAVFVPIKLFAFVKEKDMTALNEKIRSYLLSLLYFVLLTPPLFLPLLYYQQISWQRSTPLPLEQSLAYFLDPLVFLKAQLMDFQPDIILRLSSHVFYVGPFILLVLLFLFTKRVRSRLRKSGTPEYLIVALVALASATPLYAIYYFIPWLNLFRQPYKYFLPATFFLAVGALLIINTVADTSNRYLRYALFGGLAVSIAFNILVDHRNRTNTFSNVTLRNPQQLVVEKYIDKDKGRVFTFDIGFYHTPDRYQFLTDNFATLFDYYHFAGYSSIASNLNRKLSLGLTSRSSYQKGMTQELLDYLSYWSVNYITAGNTSRNRSQLESFDQLNLLHQDDALLLYENTQSLPYAYFKNQPKTALPIKFSTNHVDIYLGNDHSEELIVNIAPLPLFQYYINDQRMGFIEKSTGPISITVPPSARKVTIKYLDLPFLAGLIVTIGAFATVAFRYSYSVFVPLSRLRVPPA